MFCTVQIDPDYGLPYNLMVYIANNDNLLLINILVLFNYLCTY